MAKRLGAAGVGVLIAVVSMAVPSAAPHDPPANSAQERRPFQLPPLPLPFPLPSIELPFPFPLPFPWPWPSDGQATDPGCTPDPNRALDIDKAASVPILLTQPLMPTHVHLVGGQRYAIGACGTMDWYTHSCNGQCTSTPDGRVCEFTGFYAQGLPCWSLIGRVSESGDPFFVGANMIFTAPVSGELYLGVNDNNYPDNTGGWRAVVSPADCSARVDVDTTQGASVREELTPGTVGRSFLLYTSRDPNDEVLGGVNKRISFGIRIPDALVNMNGSSDGSVLHKWVQNLTVWEGKATYETGTHVSVPALPADARWLDTNIAPVYYGLIPFSDLYDSPSISVPLFDKDGHRLTHVDFVKQFESFLGCTTEADKAFYPEDDPRHFFRSVAAMDWRVHFAGAVDVGPPLPVPPGQQPDRWLVKFMPDDRSPIQTSVFFRTSAKPTITPPTANEVTNNIYPPR